MNSPSAAPRVCVVGAGAIGGFVGVRLAAVGARLSVLARGATLAAVRERGLRTSHRGTITSVDVQVSSDAAELGRQDIVLLCVKAPALPELAPQLHPLIDQGTMVVPLMNGVPWWFMLGNAGGGTALSSVDPQGVVAAALPIERIVGGVVYMHCRSIEAGLSEHAEGLRLIFGEPDGRCSARLESLVRLFEQAGFEAEASAAIRTDVWYKLWGNMTMNPISALTRATCDRILDDPLVERFVLDVMGEAARVGHAVGCPIDQTGEERNLLTRRLGAFKTSMLHDAEAGRPIELDAIVGAVRELGQANGIATPQLDVLLGLTRLHARVHGLYLPS